MPALPNVPGVLKVNLNWGVDGDATAQTIHYFRFTGTADAPDMITAAGYFVSNASDGFQALATSFTGVLSATVRDLTSDMGVEVTAGAPWTGTRTGDRLSPGTAALINHQIERHYRGGHPRTYLPLGSGTDVASTGLWSDAFVAGYEGGWSSFRSESENTTVGAMRVEHMVNVSYFGPPNRTITGSTGRVRTVSTQRAVPIVNQIVSSSGQKKIGSQRRRNKAA